MSKHPKTKPTMTSVQVTERKSAYVVTKKDQKYTLHIKTTASAIDGALRNPDHTLVALRTKHIHHVKLAFRDPPKKKTTGFQWHPPVPIETQAINLLTNHFNQFQRLSVYGNLEIGSFSLIVKSVKTLRTVLFHECHVSSISERHAQIAPGVVVPFGHNLRRVVFNKSSLTHSLRLADVLALTAKDPAHLVIEINHPTVLAVDFKEITNQFDKLATGNWPPGLQMDVHKICSTYLQSKQAGKRKIGQKLQALLPRLAAKMQLNSARFVASLEETADIRQAVIGLHPKRHCQKMRDIDRENALSLHPAQSVLVMKNPTETFTSALPPGTIVTGASDQVATTDPNSPDDEEMCETKRSPGEVKDYSNGGNNQGLNVLADPPSIAIPAVARASEALANALKRAQPDTFTLSNQRKKQKKAQSKQKNS